MQLLRDEEILVTSNQDKIILTNQRIQLSDKEWGRSYQITIFLENVSSIEMVYKNNPFLLLLAAACLLIGLFASSPAHEIDTSLQNGCFIFSIIFLVFWFYSKNRMVTIASNGGSKLNFRVTGMKTPDAAEFIDKVIAAKAARTKYFLGV
jgi:hypothetical protein